MLAAASAAPAVARQQEAPAARPVERAYAAPAAAPARQPVERVVAAPAPVNPQRSGASRDRPLRGGAEAEFRHHINRLRSQPSEYAALIGDRAKCYEGNILRLKRGTTMFKSQTHEGARACTEAQVSERRARLWILFFHQRVPFFFPALHELGVVCARTRLPLRAVRSCPRDCAVHGP